MMNPIFAPDSSLSSLCESFFAELCSLRLESPPPTASFASERVFSALDVAAQKVRRNPDSEQAFERIRHDLLFFADYSLSRSIPGWRSLAEEQLGIGTGEELFCHDLETVIEDERVEDAKIFRTCVGLGFSGSEAVGDEPWRKLTEALFRLVPAPRPEGLEAANPAPAPSRSGPVRRTPWLAVFFLTLTLALTALTVWQVVQAPAAYRERMTLLKAAASSSSDSGNLPSGSSRTIPPDARTVPGFRKIPPVPRHLSFAPSIPGSTSSGFVQMIP